MRSLRTGNIRGGVGGLRLRHEERLNSPRSSVLEAQ